MFPFFKSKMSPWKLPSYLQHLHQHKLAAPRKKTGEGLVFFSLRWGSVFGGFDPRRCDALSGLKWVIPPQCHASPPEKSPALISRGINHYSSWIITFFWGLIFWVGGGRRWHWMGCWGWEPLNSHGNDDVSYQGIPREPNPQATHDMAIHLRWSLCLVAGGINFALYHLPYL